MMRIFVQKLIISLIVSGLFVIPALFAATVTLKSGKEIQGTILERTDRYIRIESAGTPVYYEFKYIKSIDEGATIKDKYFYLKESLKCGAEGQFNDAQEAIKKGLGLDPADNNLREVMRMLEDLKKGAAGEDYTLHLFKGSYYLMDARYPEAREEFSLALEMNSDSPDLNYYLGICNYSLEQYSQAIVYLEKAAAVQPDAELYYYLGLSHYSLGRYPEAISYLEKVREINPADAEAYSVIGASYYSLGESDKAKGNLLKAKELLQKKGDGPKAKEIEEFLTKLN